MKKTSCNKKSIYLGIVVILILIISSLFIFKFIFSEGIYNWFQGVKSQLVNRVDNKDDANKEDNRDLSKDEVVELYNGYLLDGLKYKAAGDAGHKEDYYKAISSFRSAVDLTEGKFWIPVVNIANIYKTIGEYDNSDKYYNQALEISNYSEQSIYLAKIDLYRNYLNKDNDSIIALYEKALSDVVVDRMNLVVSYASFLKSIGKYKESLEYYNILAQNYPDNQAYKQEINWLETQVK